MNIEKLSEANLRHVIDELFPKEYLGVESQKRIKIKGKTVIPDYFLQTPNHIFMLSLTDRPTILKQKLKFGISISKNIVIMIITQSF